MCFLFCIYNIIKILISSWSIVLIYLLHSYGDLFYVAHKVEIDNIYSTYKFRYSFYDIAGAQITYDKPSSG